MASGAGAASGPAFSELRGSAVDGVDGEMHGCAGWRVLDASGRALLEVEAAAFEVDSRPFPGPPPAPLPIASEDLRL